MLMAENLTPSGFCRSERALWILLRAFERPFLERLLSAREGDGRFLPHDVVYQGQGYRRPETKARNAHVATHFGTIRLWRFGCRFWDRPVKEACIFPLERRLGLRAGVTPALGDCLGRCLAEAGATRNRVLRQMFGAGTPRYYGWARHMPHRLKRKPRGAKRVLHSAATFVKRLRLIKTRTKRFRIAYEYPPDARALDAVQRTQETPHSLGDRNHRGGLQNGPHPTPQAVRHALDRRRCPTHPHTADDPLEPNMGRHVCRLAHDS
ncbi:MAG: hypothetical protein FJ297_17170 [Planctomycetes bacterium]|nr:hypothetical protein [Planctomycetota bacterium]